MSKPTFSSFQLRWHRLIHWEYWPVWAVYTPLLPVWLYFAARARALFFFSASNPTMDNGGMGMESKDKIYKIIPPEVIPKTVFLRRESTDAEILATLNASGIAFPLIVKPDIGLKGLGVEKVLNTKELMAFVRRLNLDFLMQELVTYPLEVGIFYCRMPNETSGQITGIVSKVFLSVTGNGRDTVLDLIGQTPRALFQLPVLRRRYSEADLNEVLPPGVEKILVPFGSHTRGSEFHDISHRCTPELTRLIDDICVRTPGFYFGRLDIRYQSWEELCAGNSFKIIEINGAGSEPTHMYDPRHSLWFAWREITRHWHWLYRISRYNLARGERPMTLAEGRKMMRDSTALEAFLKEV